MTDSVFVGYYFSLLFPESLIGHKNYPAMIENESALDNLPHYITTLGTDFQNKRFRDG